MADEPPPELTEDSLEAFDLPGSSSLWRNSSFRRLWTASTISVFGSLVTRMALPFVAILTLNADAFGVAVLRSMDILAALAVGLLAGAWVDRLRRRPVMIWADLGRAVLLASIPLAAIGGWLSLPQLLVVAFLAAVLTTFFDVADNAYLPTIVPRRDLVRANGAIAATGSVSEFAAFGSAGFLVQIFSGPIAVAIDAVSFLVSALFLGSIRAPEAPPPPKAGRGSMIREIATGLRLVVTHPVLRATAIASMGFHAMWGVFGATWYLFAIDELGLDPAAIGLIAAVGGVSSLFGALLGPRLAERVGVGPLVVGASVVAALGSLFIPLAPAGAPLVAMAFLLGQQLVTDPAMTIYDINDVSIRQAIVHDRELGRVNATVQVLGHISMLTVTLGAGALALVIGLRAVGFLSVIGGVVAAIALWNSPIRRMRTIDSVRAAATSRH